MNYIKRLVGRPHERSASVTATFTSTRASRRRPTAAARLSRRSLTLPASRRTKSAHVADRVRQRLRGRRHDKVGWPLRWQSWSGGIVAPADDATTAEAWQSPDGGARTIRCRPRRSLDPLSTLYSLRRRLVRHHPGRPRQPAPQPRLITDFYAFNTNGIGGGLSTSRRWVTIGWATWCSMRRQCKSTAGRSAVRSGPRRPAFPLRYRRGVGRGGIDDRRCAGLGPGQQLFAEWASIALFLPTSTGNCFCGSTAVRCTFDAETAYRPSATTFPTARDLARPESDRAARRSMSSIIVLRRDVYYIAAENSSRPAFPTTSRAIISGLI